MKNMKLTNLSLSVLIALGLVACGGSDDKGNAATDTDTSGSTGGTGGTGPTGPKIENNGKTVPVDPARAAPSLEVEANVADSTKVAKQLYIDRRSRDAVAGYNGSEGRLNTLDARLEPIFWQTWRDQNAKEVKSTYGLTEVPASNQGGFSYNPGSTDAKDILRASSIYNYYEHQSAQGSLNAQGGIHANPNFSYVKGADGAYYRVEPVDGVDWDKITATTKFKLVGKVTKGSDILKAGFKDDDDAAKNIPMTEVVFIPNALAFSQIGLLQANANDIADGSKAYKTPIAKAGSYPINQNVYGINRLDATKISFFDVSRSEVEYKSFDLAGAHYDLVKDFNTNNIELDLSKVPVEKAIQNHAITLNYDIRNTKATGVLVDDDVISKTAKVGEMKLYNLPYSRSSITVNQDAVADANKLDAAPNNLFNFSNAGSGRYGAFQVVGFQTTAIPRDGRADYVGKSYGVNSVGDIDLRADFAIDRAGIHGAVKNRQTLDGKRQLPNLELKRIALVNNSYEEVASKGMQETSQAPDGEVFVGGRGAGYWAVSLFGPNAEEAAGIIDLDGTTKFSGGLFTPPVYQVDGLTTSSTNFNNGKNVEVFSTQRGTLIKDSLNPGVGNP